MVTIAPLLTYDDLAQLPDDGKRYELLEGELVVSPAPMRRHQRVVLKLAQFFGRVEVTGAGEAALAPFDVVFEPHNVTEPDLLFVRRERLDVITDANVQGAPDLIIEVLSPSTADRDLRAKRQVYAKFRVPHYWIVDPEARTVQVLTLGPAGYHPEPLLSGNAELGCPLFPDVTVAVATLFT